MKSTVTMTLIFFCNQRNRYTQTVNTCTRGVLRNWSLKTHMGDRRQMNDVQSRAALIYWCVWALNGSNNIQKLLFSCAGGRCWEILQSMQVVGRERQGNLKRRRAEEVWNSPIRWKHFFSTRKNIKEPLRVKENISKPSANTADTVL